VPEVITGSASNEDSEMWLWVLIDCNANDRPVLSSERAPHFRIKKYSRFDVFTAVNMKNGAFWDCYAVWLL
jgi:hypothetical protein